jgi:hypothetical protein
MRTADKERHARLLLGKIDTILKSKGADAALKALTTTGLKIPLNKTIKKWIENYRDMLLAWHAGLMPDVVKEFKTFGFRRAQNVAHHSAGLVDNKRLIHCHIACVEALIDMAERSQLATADKENCDPQEQSTPHEVSLSDIPDDQIQRGTKL